MKSDNVNAGCSLFGCIGSLILSLTIGGMLFQYSLWKIFGKDIPWYGDAVAGLACNAFIIPVAIVCWVLDMCGIPTPFIH